jgi:hypothetical protein
MILTNYLDADARIGRRDRSGLGWSKGYILVGG